MLLQGFTPIPTGEPISTVVIGVIAALGGLFRLFGGGVSGAVKTALEGIRGTIATVADNLLRFAWSIARALGKVLSALHTLWTRVVWPMLRALPRVVGRLRRLIARDLPRLLRYIERIRQILIQWYERFWRPTLEMLQRIRRMLVILRLFRIKWAEDLDARLSQVQERIMYPLRVALEHIAMVEQWINIMLTAEQTIQEAVWGNSMGRYHGDLVSHWWTAQTGPVDAITRARLELEAKPMGMSESLQALRAGVERNASPWSQAVGESLGQLRTAMGRGAA